MKKENPYQNIKLESSVDYKFLALQVAEKLKNENFKPEWRIVFLKTLFEEMKPLLTQAGIQRIQKTAQDLFAQKVQQEKQQIAQKAAESNKKPEKKEAKKGVRLHGKMGRHGVQYMDSDDDFNDDQDDQ